MSRRIKLIDDVKNDLFDFHGEKISILEYFGSSVDGLFLCNDCGYQWYANVSKVTRVTGCPNCSFESMRTSDDEVNKIITNRGCKWIDGKYERARSKIKILFDCGHSAWIAFDSFKNGSGCLTCGIKKRSDSHRTKESDVVDFLSEFGFHSFSFPNGILTQKKSSVIFYCKNNHKIERKIDKVFQYQTCGKCSPSKESQISSELKEYYEENFGADIEHKMFINPETKKWLRCDIYIPHGKIMEINGVYIEIHGSQHYVNNGFFFLSDDEFERRKKLDKMKKNFAIKNGNYIEIDLRKIKSTKDAIEIINSFIHKIIP